MSLLSQTEITQALIRLGELAQGQGYTIELLAVGGAVMVLKYQTRQSTHDVDAVIIAPAQASIVRKLAEQVAEEYEWPLDWLNDGAKGYLVGFSEQELLFTAPGIIVKSPSVPQLLAMKLSAWRDDVDIADAQHLLKQLSNDQQRVWQTVVPFLLHGAELKAEYAFLDLWETMYGDD